MKDLKTVVDLKISFICPDDKTLHKNYVDWCELYESGTGTGTKVDCPYCKRSHFVR